MKTRWFMSIVFIFAIVVSSREAHSADTINMRFSARVKVTVTSDNVTDNVNSYLNRELRALNDVELVDTDPEWEINVVTLEIKTVDGSKSGIAISTVIISYCDNQMLSVFLQRKCKDTGLKMTSGLSSHPNHWLSIGSKDDLQNLCKDIIAILIQKFLKRVVSHSAR